jgi:cytoskeletal protein CcmA (bactofilin family)
MISMNRKKISSVLEARYSMLDTRCSIPDQKSKIVNRKSPRARPGVALLIVLFIVMAITILSLGFVTRSDVELACGQNMLLRTQMDYLAESGLEHARGLILNPQDVSTGYWDQPRIFQLVSGSKNYYEVEVRQDADYCNYIIDCNAYRLDGADRIGLSCLQAELRLDPCIAYWVGSDTTVQPLMTINGDVYCNGTLTNNGDINGDAFAAGMITGTENIEGQTNTFAQAPVAWPNLVAGDFASMYYIGSTAYSVEVIDTNQPLGPFSPTGTNLAGICYGSSDVNMPGSVTINGTLVVAGDLTVGGTNTITAVKNFPALIVTGQIIMKDNSSLVINGLAQVGQQITHDSGTANASIYVTGGLFIAVSGVTSDKINVNIYPDPATASIEIWPYINTASRWSPAAGAFFRSIKRR